MLYCKPHIVWTPIMDSTPWTLKSPAAQQVLLVSCFSTITAAFLANVMYKNFGAEVVPTNLGPWFAFF